LDFGTARLVQLLEWCNSKWLLSNLIDKTTNKPLAGAVPHDLIEWNGVKIGLIGLIEDEWIQTLASVDTTTLAYEDFITCGRRLATELKQQGAQVRFFFY
jgi:5'-nucleotidase